MTTYRDVMREGENLSWCKPVEFSANGKTAVIAVNEGCIVGALFDGKESDDFELSAVADYLMVAGVGSLSDLYWTEGVESNEIGCSDCPWFHDCEAMSEEYGE